ncbi:hypothetical protein BJV78DRAFT_1212682 [Lactifluus subvellereus]|nr:hypothetical protein BJV78DRAFT_1212682 [Lactifluus subvellereus]
MLGYQQLLWFLGETITEAGAINAFAVFERPDGDLDVVMPPLDGMIIPGVTCASVLSLLLHHPHTTTTTTLPQLPAHTCIHTTKCALTMSELFTASAAGTLCEFFCVGMAAVIIPAACIGPAWQRQCQPPSSVAGPRGTQTRTPTKTMMRRWCKISRCLLWAAAVWRRHSASGSGLWISRRGASSGKGGASHAKSLITMPERMGRAAALPPQRERAAAAR